MRIPAARRRTLPSEDVLCNELQPTMAQRAGHRDKGLQRTELFILQTQYELDFRQDRVSFSVTRSSACAISVNETDIPDAPRRREVQVEPDIRATRDREGVGNARVSGHPFDPAQIKQPIQHLDRVFV